MINLQFHAPKDFNFIILCPQRNIGGFISTYKNLKEIFPSSGIICVLGEDATIQEFAEFNKICKTFKAKNTIASLLNVGYQYSERSYNLYILAKSRFSFGNFRKYSQFLLSEKDVLYPTVGKKWEFEETNVNGLLIHKKAFEEVGPFNESAETFALSKLDWQDRGTNLGYQFKAMVVNLH